MKMGLILLIACLLIGLAGCNLPVPKDVGPDDVSPSLPKPSLQPILPPEAAPTGAGEVPVLPPKDPDALIMPDDLVYLGAFRLPDDTTGQGLGWEWGGGALTYYPGGDPAGSADGFPGSLFGTGHDWYTSVSEIAIPAPVLSTPKTLDDLPMASILQDFQDIRGNLVGYLEIPRVGLEYLPPQGEQSTGKLYFAFAQHMGDTETNPSHGWAELDLSNPQAKGLWRVGDYWNYVTGDYLFAIPPEWADIYLPGRYLATGRFRDGGQGSLGPTLFAIAPWLQGNPPASGTVLNATSLLLYGSVYAGEENTMLNYCHSDEWNGAAWLTAGEKSAVVFSGTKGLGETWYGCKDGTIWPEEPPFPAECAERGWWSASFEGQILFYDPADLADVAIGQKQSWEPQPYAVLQLEPYLFHVVEEQQKFQGGPLAFDRERGLIYLLELFADADKPIVHVWQVR